MMGINHESNLYSWQTRSRVISYPESPNDEYPVDVETVKDYLNIPQEDTGQDSLLSLIIMQGTDIAQRYTGRFFLNHGYETRLDYMPWTDLSTGLYKPEYTFQRYIELPALPVYSLESITLHYTDIASSVIDYGAYVLDNFSKDLQARIVFNESFNAQSELLRAGAIHISYTVGYGTSSNDVPYGLLLGLLKLIAYLYTNRGDCVNDEQCVNASGANITLNMYRVRKL